MSEDPIGFAGGLMNLASYVGNAVPGLTDPFGLVGISPDGETETDTSVAFGEYQHWASIEANQKNTNARSNHHDPWLSPWERYWFYLTNPSEMENDLQVLNGIAWGMVGVGVGGLVGVGVGGAIGVVGTLAGSSAWATSLAGSLGGGLVGGKVGGYLGSQGGPLGEFIGEVGGGFAGGFGGWQGAGATYGRLAPGGTGFGAPNGWARPIPRHDPNTPWYKPLSPSYDADIWVKETGRTTLEIAKTWSHEIQHFADFLRYPGITHLAARSRYFPGCGAARYFLEFRGYLAGRQLTSLLTPLRSFKPHQLWWLGYDIAVFGGGGIGGIIRSFDWWNDD